MPFIMRSFLEWDFVRVEGMLRHALQRVDDLAGHAQSPKPMWTARDAAPAGHQGAAAKIGTNTQRHST